MCAHVVITSLVIGSADINGPEEVCGGLGSTRPDHTDQAQCQCVSAHSLVVVLIVLKASIGL